MLGPFPAASPSCGAAWGCCDPNAGHALHLIDTHTTGLSLLIQPVQILLHILPTFQEIGTFPQSGVVWKLAVFNTLIQLINKDIFPKTEPRGALMGLSVVGLKDCVENSPFF